MSTYNFFFIPPPDKKCIDAVINFKILAELNTQYLWAWNYSSYDQNRDEKKE